jgi:hypothetical protein
MMPGIVSNGHHAVARKMATIRARRSMPAGLVAKRWAMWIE